MSSAARISCALVVIALVICSATTVATPKSIPAGVALFTLHSSYVPTAIKRRLRRTTAMETIETAEERAPNFLVSELASSFSSLKSLPAAFYQKSQIYVEKRYRAEDNEAYKAAIAAAEKWTDPEIKKLANEAVKTAKEVAYMEPFEAVFSTLHSHYKDDMLKEILAKGSENANPEVKKVADEVKKMHEWATQEY
ncbi:unnamed protein product [Peronospora effusa]|nr:unnamed protein product [Peronospora effusa]